MPAPDSSTQSDLVVTHKTTPVLVYTDSFLYWGTVTTKLMIRVSTWLRTNAAPDNLCLYGAHAILPLLGASSRFTSYEEIHIPASKVIAYHIQPPANEPLDFDPTEANRKMEPITALVGEYHMDGFLRMATASDVNKYLEVTREVFTGIYNVTISHPAITQLNLPVIPFVLIRQSCAVIATRKPPS